MPVELIIPWRAGCEHRDRALQFILPRYRHLTVTIAEAPEGPWCKALAVMPIIEASSARTIVVADADVWSDELDLAIDAVNHGRPWAVPHFRVHRLNEAATAKVYDGVDPKTLGPELYDQSPYVGVAGGGIVVLRRDVALDVPLDPRFTGWGGEDHSWGYALDSLHGAPWRGRGPLWHLWHPPQRRATRKVGSAASERLRKRYWAAWGQHDAMRQIVEEIPWPRTSS